MRGRLPECAADGRTQLDRRAFLKASATVGLAGSAGITLMPSAAEAATIAAQRSGSPRTVTPDFFGLNGNNVQERLRWDRDDLGAALSSLGPGLLRYPGGTIGNYWDWRTGWFQPNGPWPGQTHAQTGEVIAQFDNSLARYKTGLQRSRRQGPVHAQHAHDRRSPGHVGGQRRDDPGPGPVPAGRGGRQASRSAGRAGQRVLPLRPRARAQRQRLLATVPDRDGVRPAGQRLGERPASRLPRSRPSIAAVGADATGNNSPRREGWNDGVLGTLAGVDALTLHPFIRVTNASATPQSLLVLALPPGPEPDRVGVSGHRIPRPQCVDHRVQPGGRDTQPHLRGHVDTRAVRRRLCTDARPGPDRRA